MEGNPILFVDPYGLLKFSVGFGGGFHVGPSGLTATTSVAGDTEGQICVVTQVCGTFGFGLFGGLGVTATVGSGELCEGSSQETGFFFEAGAGAAASGSITTDGEGASVGRAIVGVGGGAAGGVIDCRLETICF